jgi:hypothetical protein
MLNADHFFPTIPDAVTAAFHHIPQTDPSNPA